MTSLKKKGSGALAAWEELQMKSVGVAYNKFIIIIIKIVYVICRIGKKEIQ